ncbi:F-actin-capping protein subunit alpha [Sparganum proliferum]
MAFETIINGSLQSFVNTSAKISAEVKTQADLLVAAFRAEDDLLIKVSKMPKPDDSNLSKLLAPCSAAIQKVIEFKDSNRKSTYFNHLAAVAESVAALGWPSQPAKHIEDMVESGKFYSNRVLKEYKDKDPQQVEWVKALMEVWSQLKAFVNANHPSSLCWGSGGAPSTGSGVPAPPPPPPPPAPAPEPSQGGSAMNALFADLNRGDAVTAGLRKVTDDMKTHKNPSLRAADVTTPKSGPPPVPLRPDQRKSKSPTAAPPRLELRGNKWCVENYDKNKEITVNVNQIKESVYIYKCTNSVVNVKGKTNSIVLDSCKKTALLFESVISSVDVVNCQGMQVQVTGLMPTINIDKTDGCQVYLSEESKSAEIITAKSSEMNILVPTGDGDFAEYAVPEQFKTTFTGKGLSTTVNDLA